MNPEIALFASVITSVFGVFSILRDVKKDSINATKERAAMLSELQLVVYRVTRIEIQLNEFNKEKK